MDPNNEKIVDLQHEVDRLRDALNEIEERTRPGADMADQAVNVLARAALAPKT